jgi:anti-sigma factor RsiW
MSILQRHIDDLKAQAAASSRTARLTTDPARRAHSARLSRELRMLAKQLRSHSRTAMPTARRSHVEGSTNAKG